MRRIRKEATKVWHNPEISSTSRRGSGGGTSREPQPSQEDRRTQSQHRAALEALFAPRRDPAEATEAEGRRAARDSTPSKPGGRIVLPPPPQSDERAVERQKLLGKLLHAEGRPNVSKAADDFVRAGFTFPDDQDVHLKLLEHADEGRVRSALEALSSLLAGELPKRRAVLESRLRRIEEYAEDAATREEARKLRRTVSGRSPNPGTETP
jgi:hypothetical protein